MLKNKSIDYIFGMITGISVSITFWACTNTDLIASNDTGSVQQVEITNWSSMPDVKISSSDNDVDCNVDFPSSMDVKVTNTPTVSLSSNDIDINSSIDCNVDFPSSMNVKVTNESWNPVYVTDVE